jgi:hypothetical protein
MTRTAKLLFLVLAGVAVALIATIAALNYYHSQDRLTREKLAKAQKLWEAARIEDYDIRITVQGRTSGDYAVQVRGGRAVGGTINGLPFDPPGLARSWTMQELLFTILERDLENDAKPDSPVVHTQVEFDPQDGHLIHYLRNSSRQNVVLDIQLQPIRTSTPPKEVTKDPQP